jgi:hypothetical protein
MILLFRDFHFISFFFSTIQASLIERWIFFLTINVNKTLKKKKVVLAYITSQNTIYFNNLFKKNVFLFQFWFHTSTFSYIEIEFHDLF